MNTDTIQADDPPTIPAADPNPHPPAFALPANACDCHAHLFGPQARYPYAPNRRYTPPDASLDDYLRMLKVLGIQRAVLVQPSVYKSDNRCLLDALKQERDFPLRGIAVVDEHVSDDDLQAMHAAGVRGLRLNLRAKDSGSPDQVAPYFARRIAPLGWHLQFRIKAEDFVQARPMIDALPVPVVIDHIGGIAIEEGLASPSFKVILGLLKQGRCYVKLSAPMRISRQAYPYADVLPFVHALVDAAPQQLLWATDWPHTTLPGAMPNDGDLCDLLETWIPDARVRQTILVDNPARVYGF